MNVIYGPEDITGAGAVESIDGPAQIVNRRYLEIEADQSDMDNDNYGTMVYKYKLILMTEATEKLPNQILRRDDAIFEFSVAVFHSYSF